ncbi:hypothetical protein [Nocardioides sp. 1609]|uniref:hypothetical protein n=1 Tax=Nocardioides sp. 1609 TaxID=2508327 RepID=UPI00106F9417|nr:hypothetical protein [Nocardioides sp. 1609]
MANGKRAGARTKRRFRPALLALALGVTLAVVAWGYLVYAAIDFGTSARGGDSTAWWFLALAALGAVACLFLGLVLVTRISRAIGLTRGPEPRTPPGPTGLAGSDGPTGPTGPTGPAAPPPTPGGRRAAR